MNDRILVTVHLPAAYKKFEVMLPLQGNMQEIQAGLSRMLADLSGGMFSPSPTTMLLDKSNGNFIGINATAEELHLRNGSQLLLI